MNENSIQYMVNVRNDKHPFWVRPEDVIVVKEHGTEEKPYCQIVVKVGLASETWTFSCKAQDVIKKLSGI